MQENINVYEKFLCLEPIVSATPCVHSNIEMQGKRKIFYISDIHCEFKFRKGYEKLSDQEYISHVIAKMNGDEPFGDNPLIIVGDISSQLKNVDFFFSRLRMRRDGIIIFILGNHEIWAYDSPIRDLDKIVEMYRAICNKYDVILLQNELAFFYDERTGNGDLLPFFKHHIISEKDLLDLSIDKIQAYAEKAKMIVYGGLGFSGKCKAITRNGNIYNADVGLYRDIVPSLAEDIIQSFKCEKAYFKVVDALSNYPVIIATHSPFENWSESVYNPNYIYVSGHTHHNTFNMTLEKTLFADNQVGYTSDNYDLRYFLIDGTYDCFISYPDGIHEITYEQYIDFNIGKNVRLKKKNDGKQIILLKKGCVHMFVYYNASNSLMLLNGGSNKRLSHDLNYYYENLDKYAGNIKKLMSSYTDALLEVSKAIKTIGGEGTIHGCIVDIDCYNHIYINPIDGKITPYFAYDLKRKYVYKDLYALLEDKKPSLLSGYNDWKKMNPDNNMISIWNTALADRAVLVTDKSMYRASRIVKGIQYLLFQDIVREWNDKILFNNNQNETYSEIENIMIDKSIYNLMSPSNTN